MQVKPGSWGWGAMGIERGATRPGSDGGRGETDGEGGGRGFETAVSVKDLLPPPLGRCLVVVKTCRHWRSMYNPL